MTAEATQHVGQWGVSSRQRILDLLDERVQGPDGALVILVKVEGMKSFNHAHGVRAGDKMLSILAERLLGMVGTIDRVGSLQGDVFVVLDTWMGARSPEVIERAAEQLTERIQVGELHFQPRIAVGIAQAAPGKGDADELLSVAGAAMRAARKSQAEVVSADRKIRTTAHIESVIDRDIEAAIVNDELGFAYQPLVTLADQHVHGAEALLRWSHPEFGPINPAAVVERIEAIGLCRRFTEWSLERVGREWAGLTSNNPDLDGMSVSVNFTEAQLSDRDCAAMVHEALRRHNLRPDRLIVEVVESGPTGVGERAEATLRALAENGSLIVLDDFGTGLNALEYFLRFPIHGIKFDRSLINSIGSNHTATVIVRGVARIARELDVATVAEGVETATEAATSRDLGLTFGQGWHFGYPVSIEELCVHATATRHGAAQSALHRETFNE